MMKVNTTIKLNVPFIKKLSNTAVIALEQTAEALHTEVVQAQVIPRNTGALQNEKMFVDTSESKSGKVTIVHEGPYARRLYFHPEYNFQTGENPNAKGLWYEDWQEGGEYGDFCKNTYEKFYRRLADL